MLGLTSWECPLLDGFQETYNPWAVIALRHPTRKIDEECIDEKNGPNIPRGKDNDSDKWDKAKDMRQLGAFGFNNELFKSVRAEIFQMFLFVSASVRQILFPTRYMKHSVVKLTVAFAFP